jgi:hypothetical protein
MRVYRRIPESRFIVRPLRIPWDIRPIRSRTLWHESEGTESDCEVSDSARPEPFVCGFPCARGWPQFANDLLLHGRFDGGQWHWRRSKEYHQAFQHTVIGTGKFKPTVAGFPTYQEAPRKMAMATVSQAEQVACFPDHYARVPASPFPILSGGQ